MTEQNGNRALMSFFIDMIISKFLVRSEFVLKKVAKFRNETIIQGSMLKSSPTRGNFAK